LHSRPLARIEPLDLVLGKQDGPQHRPAGRIVEAAIMAKQASTADLSGSLSPAVAVFRSITL
jgi:hypothetical protein